jgi:CRP/FNR family transcriptional regulator, nitrogen oxide reductase regulator
MPGVSETPPADWRDALDSAELLRELPAAARTALAAAAVARQVARRERLFTASDDADTFYVLLAGRIKLLRANADGQEVIVRFVGPGEILGAVAALPAARYPATAEVVDDARLAAWSREALAPIAAAHPELMTQLLGVVTQRMGEVQGQLQELATERVARRVARALLRLAAQLGRKTDAGVLIDLPLSRQNLAELTGTTLYTVSRLLSAWESEGLLEVGRERVTIRSPHGLVRIAEDLD